MAVYQKEIRRLSEKLMQKMTHYLSGDIELMNQSYRWSDLMLLNQMIQLEGPLSVSEWSEVVDVRLKHLGPAFKRLTATGDLVRIKSPEDSRKVLVSVAPHGHLVHERFEQIEQELTDVVLRDLTVNEEKAVLRFLSRLNQLTVEKYKKK